MVAFIDKFVTDSFLTFSPDLTNFTFTDVVIGMFWSISLSFLVATTYRITHRGVSYSQSFTQTLVILSLIVSSIMLIVGTDIARAFALVGSLSIIRFRNAMKDTRDVGFIFFSMAVGMACGTRFYAMGILLAVVGSTLVYFMTVGQFGQKGIIQDILEFDFPQNLDYKPVVGSLFKSNMKSYSLLSIDSVGAKMNRYSFVVTFKNEDKKSRVFDELQHVLNVQNPKILSGENTVEL